MRAPPRGQGAGTAAQRAGEGGVTPAAGAAGGCASRCLPAPPGAPMGWRAQPPALMFTCCSWLQGAVHENGKHVASQLCTRCCCRHLLRSTSHPVERDAPLRLQADRALHKALREADEQLRKMQARASSHADTSQALSEGAAACCGGLPPEAAAEAFLGTCAQLDVLRALRDRASAAEQLSAAAARLVSLPLHLSCSPHAAPHLTCLWAAFLPWSKCMSRCIARGVLLRYRTRGPLQLLAQTIHGRQWRL